MCFGEVDVVWKTTDTQSTQLKDKLKLCSKKWTMPEKDYHSKG